MIEKEVQFRKKRELGEIISSSFDFIKQEYKPVASLIVTYVLPFLVLYAIAQVYVQVKVVGSFDFSDPDLFADPDVMMANFVPFYKNIFLFSLFGIFVQSLLLGTYYSYIEIYVKKGKGNFDISEIKPYLFSNSLLALGAGFAIFIISMIGLSLCFLPGIYFANSLSVTAMIVIFERKGLGSALSRSWRLVNHQWWNTLLLNIVGIALVWAIGFIISIPTLLIGTPDLPLNGNGTGLDYYLDFHWILVGISSIASSLLMIVPFTFLAMQYFNLDERTRPESSDIQNIS